MAFSALLPVFKEEWKLSSSEAGIIMAGFQGGYVASSFLLGFLCDRISAKKIIVSCTALSGIAGLGFVIFARDFLSVFLTRTLVGISLGGLYLPGLKIISEAFPENQKGIATGLFVASSSIGYAICLSYLGFVTANFGWKIAMLIIAMTGFIASAATYTGIEGSFPGLRKKSPGSDYFHDILKNKPAMMIITGYTGHNWELFGMWGWTAPFLISAFAVHGYTSTTSLSWGGVLSGIIIGIGAFGSIIGGRVSDRLGRKKAIILFLSMSLICSLSFGWIIASPVWFILLAGLAYGILVLADSPSYTTGLMDVVPKNSLGGALSVQSLVGWGATIASPYLFGVILDLTNDKTSNILTNWGWAYVSLGIGPIVGIIAMLLLKSSGSRRL